MKAALILILFLIATIVAAVLFGFVAPRCHRLSLHGPRIGSAMLIEGCP